MSDSFPQWLQEVNDAKLDLKPGDGSSPKLAHLKGEQLQPGVR